MEKIKEYKGIIIFALVVFVVVISLYVWKQVQIRKFCSRFMEQSREGGSAMDKHIRYVYGDAYYECLKSQRTK